MRSSLFPAIALIAVASSTAGAQAISAFSARKAESLLATQLPCLGCHTINGSGGTIGPDLTTVRARRSAAYIAAIVADPQRVVPGAIMPLTRMLPTTRDLIVRYIASRPVPAPVPEGPLPSVSPAPIAGDSAQLYARFCAPCHGSTGEGNGPNAATLPVKPAAHSSRGAMSERPDDSLFDTIASGGLIMNRSPRMPAFGATLSPPQIRALVGYIRQLCRCEGPAWSRSQVRR